MPVHHTKWGTAEPNSTDRKRSALPKRRKRQNSEERQLEIDVFIENRIKMKRKSRNEQIRGQILVS